MPSAGQFDSQRGPGGAGAENDVEVMRRGHAVLAWAQLHGSVGLEAAGQFTGMGHDGDSLLVAQIAMLADAFALA